MLKPELIDIEQLVVDPRNPRYEPVESQHEAIEQILQDQDTKILNLADDIVENGINPAELLIVTRDDKDEASFIALEGNRRLATLKVLANPDILQVLNVRSLLKNRLKALSADYRLNPVVSMNCVVFESRAEAQHWIRLRHTGENEGIGIVRWTALQIERFNSQMGIPAIKQQVIDFVLEYGDLDDETSNQVNQIAVSNLERLLEDPDVRRLIGVEMKSNILHTKLPPEEAVKGLRKIIIDLTAEGDARLNVNKIRRKHDRTAYIETFTPSDIPDKSQETDTSRPLAEASINKSTPKPIRPKGQRDRKPSHDRPTLIPKACIIKIPHKRLHDIYIELKQLEIEKHRNAVAVLFRVFIEGCVDSYIEVKGIAVPPQMKLKAKINVVVDFIKGNGLMTKDEIKPVNVAVGSKDHILSINTFNSYVHNRDIVVSPTDLKVAWDQVEKFIKTIWA